jgi:hypothetical protein
LKRGQQVRWLARFHEMPITSRAQRADSLVWEITASEGDDWDRRCVIGCFQPASDLPPIDIWQPEIQDEHIDVRCVCKGQRIVPRLGHDNIESLSGQI